MAGYSGTPLIKKLGIKEGFAFALIDAPKNFRKELGMLPANVKVVVSSDKRLDLIMLFVTSERGLIGKFSLLASKLSPAGMLWVAWPKKSSGVPTDLSFSTVQRVGLDAGLVDVKICAVNDVWSGLKFVYRLKDRRSR
jgi:hypothetical protein